MTALNPRFGKNFTLALNRFVLARFYDIKIIGSENIPKEGGGLIVSNHLSWADASLLLYAFKRPIRFLIFRDIHNLKIVNSVTHNIGCIPISYEDNPKEIIRAFKTAKEAIDNGELVGIFPEGKISRNGQLLEFQKGISRLLGKKIIPVNIAGLASSFMTPPLGRKDKQKLFGRISLAVGPAKEGVSSVEEVRQDVMCLSPKSFGALFDETDTLGKEISKTLKRNPFKVFFSDTTGKSLKGITLNWAAAALAKKIKGEFGIFLPTSCAAVIASVAACYKEVPVIHLNYTSDPNPLIKAAELKQVLTSKLFIRKTGVKLDCEVLYLEDILTKPGLFALLGSYFSSSTSGKAKLTDTAAMVFTSGSTSSPKGVLLSHLNLLSNARAIANAYLMLPSQKILGILPPFHSFGLTGNIFLPLLTKVETVLHSNPLESATIGKLIEEHKPDVLIATPTFLSMWERKLGEDALKDISYIVTGSEPLPERLLGKYSLFQGYGCTENSPVVSVSAEGADPKSCGRPINGTAIKLEPIEGGHKIFISGTSLMKGYYGMEPIGEWYDTGDIGQISEQGELFITGRLSRFSKIAGEMVSHQAIEEAINDKVIVVGVPDDRKGEKLFCLHTGTLSADEVKSRVRQAGLPNIAIPDLHEVEELPKTGTGKPNLGEAKRIVQAL